MTHHPASDLNRIDQRVFPSTAVRGDSCGQLKISGLRATELLDRFGSPLYVIDEDEARRRARDARQAFARAAADIGTEASVYYAGKAFLCVEVARWMAAEGLNLDVASGGELAVALAAGVDPARIGFHGNNKSVAEIERAVRAGVGTIILDSEAEIARVADAASRAGTRQGVRLRVNSGVHASTHDYLATAHEDQKFGVPLGDAPALVRQIHGHSGLAFRGLHCHIGSQIFATGGFRESARRLLSIYRELAEITGAAVPELNLGGGFGIAYLPEEAAEAPSFARAATEIAQIVAEVCAELGLHVPRLAFEPGRSIIGPAGVTLYSVGTVKPVTLAGTDAGAEEVAGTAAGAAGGTDAADAADAVDAAGTGAAAGAGGGVAATEAAAAPQQRLYVSVDGGMSDNARPALYGANYHAVLANRRSEAPGALSRVVGKHCEAGDIVVYEAQLPADVEPGDVIAVAATGAYCWSLSSNYNYVPRPPVVAVRDGHARVIVRGETEEDLLARSVVGPDAE